MILGQNDYIISMEYCLNISLFGARLRIFFTLNMFGVWFKFFVTVSNIHGMINFYCLFLLEFYILINKVVRFISGRFCHLLFKQFWMNIANFWFLKLHFNVKCQQVIQHAVQSVNFVSQRFHLYLIPHEEEVSNSLHSGLFIL